MGRTYRNKDKKFRKLLKESRRVRKNKRHLGIEEYTDKQDKNKRREDTLGSFIFA